MKTNDDHFADWEAHFLGFGYGSGEEHVLPALKAAMAAIPPEDAEHRNYDYTALEAAVGPAVAWFIINLFGHADVIEYGGSPRFGWLTPHGYALKRYIDSKTADELYEVTAGRDERWTACFPDHCNCDEAPCHNPFWREITPRTTNV